MEGATEEERNKNLDTEKINKIDAEEMRSWADETEDSAEKESEGPKSFENIKNFDDLYIELEIQAEIKGSRPEPYKPSELINIIHEVKTGQLNVNYIPRVGGLRKKVGELLDNEKNLGESIVDDKDAKQPDVTKEKKGSLEEAEDKTIADQLTPKNIRSAVEKDEPIEVKILGSSGRMESGWMTMGVNKEGMTMVAKQPEDGKGNPEHHNLRLEQLKNWNSERNPDELFERINVVKNFDELEEELELVKGIQGSKEFFEISKLEDIIDKVKSGELGIEYVTRGGGLRQKVRELIDNEKKLTPEKKPGFFGRLLGRRKS